MWATVCAPTGVEDIADGYSDEEKADRAARAAAAAAAAEEAAAAADICEPVASISEGVDEAVSAMTLSIDICPPLLLLLLCAELLSTGELVLCC